MDKKEYTLRGNTKTGSFFAVDSYMLPEIQARECSR